MTIADIEPAPPQPKEAAMADRTETENLAQAVGAQIRWMRTARGWTLETLAKKVGTTAQTVQRLEVANMALTMEWLEKIATAFGCSPKSFFPGEAEGESGNIDDLTNLVARALGEDENEDPATLLRASRRIAVACLTLKKSGAI